MLKVCSSSQENPALTHPQMFCLVSHSGTLTAGQVGLKEGVEGGRRLAEKLCFESDLNRKVHQLSSDSEKFCPPPAPHAKRA